MRRGRSATLSGCSPRPTRAGVFPDGDGITAGELTGLTRMHLSTLGAA